MLVYHDKKSVFINDVLTGQIADKIKEDLHNHGIEDENVREYNSWNNSMHFMMETINDNQIPDESFISIEYEIPLTSKRVDFIIAGADDNNQDNVIIVELKQWTTCEKVDDIEKHTVRAFVANNNREVAHPSYQAYSYKVHIMSYSEAASDKNLHLIPCAFCHNFREEDRKVLEDPIYSQWVKEAPVFLKNDLLKLRDFIKKRITKKSINGDVLYEIDNGKIRPAKALQDCIASMLKGNQEFELLDDQVTIYDKCIKAISDTERDQQKRVIIIQGGPGTGKSVLAINLLCESVQRKLTSAYLTKNSTPRKCYQDILSKDNVKDKISIEDLFRSPYRLRDVPKNIYDCLFIDEAHRLVKKMKMDYHGENEIKECIEASKVSIFFIDETQRISTDDIGSVQSIKDWAYQLGVDSNHVYFGDGYKLSSQFRCNGSDGYISFINNLLGIEKTANNFLDLEGFDFKVYDDPNKMRDDLRIKNNINNKSRMVAGYCFDWNVKNNRGDWDIFLDNGFKAKWNSPNSKGIWAILPSSFEDVGCIHTCQGMEFDYVGVIIGNDLRFIDGKVQTDKNSISKDDRSSGIRSCKDPVLADQLIRNTYKVLMTRGQKGCYVYCTDPNLREYIKSKVHQS